MTREIKFRAWDKEKKIMYLVDSLDWDENGQMSGSLTPMDSSDSERVGVSCLGERAIVDEGNPNHPDGWIEDYAIMQFTGLKDKNGKEIYEGDIISLGEKFPKLVVRFEYGMFCVQNDSLHHYVMTKFVEVIGNIWQNPELLTPTKKKD